MRRFFWVMLILGITVAAAVACGDDSDDDDGGDAALSVVTTLPLFADFVREVGGDRVDVDALLPSGADPHTWEPAPQDVAQIADADVVFANGLDLEPAALNVIEPNLADDAVLVLLGEEAAEHPLSTGLIEGGAEGDPHLWLHVDNARAYVEVIRDTLVEADPEGMAEYEANRRAYQTELNDLGLYVSETVAGVPQEYRKLITTHDAFGYLADFVGFEITAFVSEGPGQETSPDAIRQIIDAIRESGLPAVFSEPQLGGEGNTLEQVATDEGVEVCTLYSDSLDDRVTSYIELMRFNADEIARCLGGAGGG